MPAPFRLVVIALAAGSAAASGASRTGVPRAGELEVIARAYREAPSPSRQAALERLASGREPQAALARFALGVVAYEQTNYSQADRYLAAARPRLPEIADYIHYYQSATRLELSSRNGKGFEDPEDAPEIPSPVSGKLRLLAAQRLAASGLASASVELLRRHYALLPQPEGDFRLAQGYEAAGDSANAAAHYQRVYCLYPASEPALKAAAALLALRERMGADYPPPMPQLMLARGDKLLEARDYLRARSEFQSLALELGGLERDQARVRAGVADFMRGQSSSAATYFSMLELDESEADAERLYYLAECARRGDDRSEMLSLIERLSARYPNSPWRLKALISAGNAFLLDNEHEKFEPLYEAAHANFAGQPEAAYPHWKLAWRSYLSRRRDAAERLRAHLIHYPSGSKASAALYFLGRMAESAQDFSSARAYYEKLLQQYPNFYHAVLARERLAERRLILAPAGPSKAAEFLTTVAFPERLLDSDSRPTPATLRRIERARLLRSAGLAEWAESELRFGARHDGQPRLLALELAAAASAPHQALRLMKSTAPNYLAADLRRAPAEFWERLFPLPYREDILRSSRLAGLDPFMVAALIRQESEFNPQAVSRANARGLTQVMPSTGRQLARRLKIRRFNNRLLFEPATNLRLGTLYLRGLLDEWGGRWEQALASYNAGATRVEEWLGWGDFREPAEFVETIPFTETREYVQSVIRNASIYRQLYSGTDLFAPAGGGSEARAARQPGGKKGS